MKTCPECAEDVKSAARVCRFCRHRFDTAPTTTPVRDASHRRTPWVLGALLATFVLVVAAAVWAPFGIGPPDDQRRSTQGEDAPGNSDPFLTCLNKATTFTRQEACARRELRRSGER